MGLGIDETTGRAWGLLKPDDQEESINLLTEDQAELLVVAPPCTKFSCLQNLKIRKPSQRRKCNLDGRWSITV